MTDGEDTEQSINQHGLPASMSDGTTNTVKDVNEDEDEDEDEDELISREDTIEFKKRRVFYLSIILASTLISSFLVNINFFRYYLDLVTVQEPLINKIPLISQVLFIVDHINALYGMMLLLCAFILIKYGVYTFMERDRTELLILHERGVVDKYLITSKIKELYKLAFKGSVIGTIVGALLGYAFTHYSAIEENTLSYVFPYSRFFLLPLITIYLTYFPLLLIITFGLMILSVYIVFYQIKDEHFGDESQKAEILGFNLGRSVKNNEKAIIIGITSILTIGSVYFFINTLLTTAWFDFVFDLINSYFLLDYLFNLLPISFLVVFQYVNLISTPRSRYKKSCVLIIFTIMDLFIIHEIALATMLRTPNIIKFFNSIPAQELVSYLFVIFAGLSLVEVLTNKIVGAFGFFTIFGILTTGLDVTNILFLILLSFVAFFIFIVGVANTVDRLIARSFIMLTPVVKDVFGRTQGFLSPRLLSRRAAYSALTVSFLVFAIIAGTTTAFSYSASIKIYSDEAKWETGADINLGLEAYSRNLDIPEENIEAIAEYPQVESVTRVLEWNYYFTGFAETENTTNLILIEPDKFLETGFYRDDWFIGGTAAELIAKLQESKYNIILDSKRANTIGKRIGDQVTLKHQSGSSKQTYDLTIVGLVDYFIFEHSTKSNKYSSFGIMNIDIADPVFVALNVVGFNPIDKNPTSCYLIKTKSSSGHTKLIQNFLDDQDILYLNPYDSYSFIDKIQTSSVAQELFYTPQIVGVVAITCLALFVIVFVRINASKNPEEERDYALLRTLGLDKIHLYLVSFTENTLLVSTTIAVSLIASLFITFSVNLIFLPKTEIPKIFDLVGILDGSFQSLLGLGLLISILLVLVVIPLFSVLLNTEHQIAHERKIKEHKKSNLYNIALKKILVVTAIFVFCIAAIELFGQISIVSILISILLTPWIDYTNFNLLYLNLLFYSGVVAIIVGTIIRSKRLIRDTADFSGRQKAGLSKHLHR